MKNKANVHNTNKNAGLNLKPYLGTGKNWTTEIQKQQSIDTRQNHSLPKENMNYFKNNSLSRNRYQDHEINKANHT